MKSFLLALLALCVISSPGFAQSTSGDGMWLYTVQDNEAKLVGITQFGLNELSDRDYRAGFDVPAYVDGYPLTTIGRHAFDNLRTFLWAPGSHGFLTFDGIGTTATKVEEFAFAGVSVKTVSLGDGTPSLSIGDNAFRGSRVEYVYVMSANAVTTIGAGAFYDANAFGGFKTYNEFNQIVNLGPIPPGVTSVGYKAFHRAWGIPNKVAIPSSITQIDTWFTGSTVTSLIIPDTVTYVTPNAFNDQFDGNPRELFFKGSPPAEPFAFQGTIYRLPEASGWSNTFGGAPVRIFLEKPTGDGSMTYAFPAAGDTNFDWQIDVLDAAAFVSAAKFDSGLPATWNEGDFTYDGLVDILDVASFVSNGLFDAGAYDGPGAVATVAAVPEPASLGGIAVVVAIATAVGRRSRRPN